MPTGPVPAPRATHASAKASSVSTRSGRPSRSSSRGGGGGGGPCWGLGSSATGWSGCWPSGVITIPRSQSRPPLTSPAGHRGDPFGDRREPGGRAHQLAPRLDVRRDVDLAVVVDDGAPGRADLDL